ncbi:hypothetical protein ACOJUR_12945 [Alicyclobacillus tolerans]|uniref:Uncharacterized protein n=2 Tax=Alicyclobacillus tolerans TaxID=90970 RepID=A0ABT9LSE3_9BACL|nr:MULTISPECIES: hypothetical protein [Alicyclobacillus]MDP9727179.1 hypothetical protein [Alicyclobacillus tengchongensis]QRF22943.1 hypothetical protein FY534_04060 [Alicyclobacillus sp. TC]SHK45806.1 hypothetical protein SAMN05443507_11426 [Alicyclobacillus montanus]
MHPLYHHAIRLRGQSVYVHHLNGTVYHGVLHSVTTKGIYLLPHRPGGRLASAQSNELQGQNALHEPQDMQLEEIFFPAMFFGFGALAGLAAASGPWGWGW